MSDAVQLALGVSDKKEVFMRRVMSFFLLTIVSMLLPHFTLESAMANPMVGAYVLLETPSGLEAVRSSSGSFSNCKPLFHVIFTGEILVHIHCNDVHDLNEAITRNLSKVEGVSRITILRIRVGEGD